MKMLSASSICFPIVDIIYYDIMILNYHNLIYLIKFK